MTARLLKISARPQARRTPAAIRPTAQCWLVPLSALASATGGWAMAAHGLAWAIPPLLGAGILTAIAVAHQCAAEQLAAALNANGARRSLLANLRIAAAAMNTVEHRLDNHHPVTRLPTREFLIDAMTADFAGGRTAYFLGAIRFVDFDRMAAFDQTGAHDALQRFAKRLSLAAKRDHVIGQIDRDCFGIWFADAGESAASEFRALIHVASQELAEDDVRLTPTIEAGAAEGEYDGVEPSQILSRVTGALTQVAASTVGDIAVAFSPSAEIARDLYALEQDLAQAIADDQLTMVFQPVVDLREGRLIGAEALLRWEHPTLGPVSPGKFIPMVEALGLSESYGLWVLNAACREAKLWEAEGLSGLKVAVNLSARQLAEADLKIKIERTLERHRLDPKALELELTETAAMADAERTRQLFTELRSLGISLAIDDFGAGYSSLSYVKNLPFDKLKIDREFVTDVHRRRDSQAICSALIALGQGLGLLVLAEGVESAEEVAVLHDLGCDIFQGYYFSRPLPSEGFRALARDTAWNGRLKPSLPAFESRLSA